MKMATPRAIPSCLSLLTLTLTATLLLLMLNPQSNSANTLPEMDKLAENHRQFMQDESARKEAAAKRFLLNSALKLNGNQSDYDIKYYGVHVSLDFATETIEGAIDYQFASLVPSLSSLDLNLVDQLTVDSVFVGGTPAAFSHAFDLLAISLPAALPGGQEATMTVFYHGPPLHLGGYASGGMDFALHNGYQICWTSVEPFNARNWWPCKDTPSDKADSLDLWIECPDNMYAASNGTLVEVVPAAPGREIYHWKHRYPITTYLVALSVASFNVNSKTWNWNGYSMPVFAYNLPNAWSTITCYDTLTIPVLNHFSDAYGVYPFVNEKLGNADCGTWGTMEHQTCSFHDPFSGYSKEYLVIHENAHQWWGDMITCKTFHDVWLNEGFGTYSEAIFYESEFNSEQVYLDYMQLLKWVPYSGTVYVENPEVDVIFDPETSYDKGAWIVHMLRGVLGNEDFFQFIKDWGASSFRYGSATTADLSQFCSDWTGKDMDWFFQQWIFQYSCPIYDYSWICQPDTLASGYHLFLRVEQTQTHYKPYKMPVRMEFVTTGGQVDTTLWNNVSDQFYQLHFADSVISVAFDPDEWILRVANPVPMGTYVPNICPDAVLGEEYYYEIPVFGGTAPHTWTLLGGDVPYGMTYSAGESFILSGTPTYAATYYLSIRVVDSSVPPNITDRSVAITVLEPQDQCGDADGSGQTSISDAVFIINYIFAGGPAPAGGTADVDCSGTVSIGDAVYLINYIFGGGPAPCAGC